MSMPADVEAWYAALRLGTDVQIDIRRRPGPPAPPRFARILLHHHTDDPSQPLTLAAEPAMHGCDARFARALGWLTTRTGARPTDPRMTARGVWDMQFNEWVFGDTPTAGVLRIEYELWKYLGDTYPFDRMNARRRQAAT